MNLSTCEDKDLTRAKRIERQARSFGDLPCFEPKDGELVEIFRWEGYDYHLAYGGVTRSNMSESNLAEKAREFWDGLGEEDKPVFRINFYSNCKGNPDGNPDYWDQELLNEAFLASFVIDEKATDSTGTLVFESVIVPNGDERIEIKL